jgi:hypothetical protein
MNRIRSVSVSSVATGLSVVLLITVGMPAVARAECVALWKTARDAQRVATVVFSGTVVGTDGSLETSFEVTVCGRVTSDERRRSRYSLESNRTVRRISRPARRIWFSRAR